MITVTILGSGHVAYHLIQKIIQLELQTEVQIELKQVWARNKSSLPENVIGRYVSLENLVPTDLTIIAVTDSAIAEVSKKIPYQDHLVVHTSGSTSYLSIDSKHKRGVLYPLQTFSKTKPIDFEKIPILIESEQEETILKLQTFAHKISKNVQYLNENQRQYLHVAAVFACNFTNHLYAIASEICDTHSIDFQILYPLIEETTQKIKILTPKEAQTGPAKRNDKPTIEKHISLLESMQKDIYKQLTQSIQTYDKKL